MVDLRGNTVPAHVATVPISIALATSAKLHYLMCFVLGYYLRVSYWM